MMDSCHPGRGENHRDRHLAMKDPVPALERTQTSAVKGPGRSEHRSPRLQSDQPSHDATHHAARKGDGYDRGDVQLARGGNDPARNQEGFPGTRETGRADHRTEGETHVVERRAMEAVVKEVVKKRMVKVKVQMDRR